MIGLHRKKVFKTPNLLDRHDIALALVPVYAGIAAACFLVFCIGRWGMLREMEAVRQSVRNSQISLAKSHAERTVARLELDVADANGIDLSTAANANWLHEHWRRTRDQEPIRKLRAVVDTKGTILAHSNSQKVGQTIQATGKLAKIPGIGIECVEIKDSVLTDNLQIIDIPHHIRHYGRIVGTYHVGISTDWLNSKIATEQVGAWRAWSVVIVSATTIVGATGILIFRLARRAAKLERDLHFADTKRLRELSTLMVGMAHEIRNPLNSIRLNLHTSERVFRGESQLGCQEVVGMLYESVREIVRIDSLIGQLLGYASMENEQDDVVDVGQEIQSAIQFVKSDFDSQAITIEFRNRAASATMIMNRRRLRQILLNLLNNARSALEGGGRIRITLAVRGRLAQLSIADSGVGVEPSIRGRLFEPFVTTRDEGTGLGLAVVKSMIEGIGGAIDYTTSAELGGAEFVLSFPVSDAVRN